MRAGPAQTPAVFLPFLAPGLAPHPFPHLHHPRLAPPSEGVSMKSLPGSAFKSRLLRLSCEGSSRGRVTMEAEDAVMLPQAKEC